MAHPSEENMARSKLNCLRRLRISLKRGRRPSPSSPASNPPEDERPYRAQYWLALKVLEQEAHPRDRIRRDQNGYLKRYGLPPDDGGGRYEYGGINQRYHPEMYRQLDKAPPERREVMAAAYIDGYFRRFIISPWVNAGIEFLMMDACFNRGPSGVTVICQWALNDMGLEVEVDGGWGPETRDTLLLVQDDRETAVTFIAAFRRARELYERTPNPVAGISKGSRDESSDLWEGLVNRWNNTTTFALSIE